MILPQTHEAFEQLDSNKACSALESCAHKRQVYEFQSKRRKKVALDQNERFLDVHKIKAAKNALERRRCEFEPERTHMKAPGGVFPVFPT
jgi:hypothetical protein